MLPNSPIKLFFDVSAAVWLSTHYVIAKERGRVKEKITRNSLLLLLLGAWRCLSFVRKLDFPYHKRCEKEGIHLELPSCHKEEELVVHSAAYFVLGHNNHTLLFFLALIYIINEPE